MQEAAAGETVQWQMPEDISFPENLLTADVNSTVNMTTNYESITVPITPSMRFDVKRNEQLDNLTGKPVELEVEFDVHSSMGFSSTGSLNIDVGQAIINAVILLAPLQVNSGTAGMRYRALFAGILRPIASDLLRIKIDWSTGFSRIPETAREMFMMAANITITGVYGEQLVRLLN